MLGRISFASNRRRGQISQGMANKRRGHATIAIEFFFEGKNHQRFVNVLAQQTHASLAPRPELRRDVIHHGDVALLHLARHAPVEGRRIDDDGQDWPLLISRANQSPIEPKNLRQTAKNLSDADDREILSVDNNLASRSPHALPASAKEFEL